MLSQLLRSYYTHGFWFFLCHLALVLTVLYQLVQFWRWNPVTGDKASSWEALEVKTQFIRGLNGLFMLVGIAGTFYGLFEFAVNIETANLPVKAALVSAIAKAFPVGFMGLVLGFAGNVFLDILEKSKTRLVSEALGDKEGRLEAIVQAGLVSIHVALKANTAETAGRLAFAIDEFRNALRPVVELEGTLTRSLQPVVERLGTSLDASTAVLLEQGNRLEAGKDALISASGHLKSSAESIAAALGELSTIGKTAKAALRTTNSLADSLEELFNEQKRAIEDARLRWNQIQDTVSASMNASLASFGEVNARLQETIVRLDRVPGSLSDGLRDGLIAINQETEKQLHAHLEHVAGEAQTKLIQAFNLLSVEIAGYQGSITRMSAELMTLRNDFANTQELLVGTLSQSVESLSRQFEAQLTGELRRVFEPVDRAQGELRDFQAVMSKLSTGVAAVTQALASSLAVLETEYAKTHDQLAAALRQSVSVISSQFADQLRGEIQKAFDPVSQTQKEVEEFQAALITLGKSVNDYANLAGTMHGVGARMTTSVDAFNSNLERLTNAAVLVGGNGSGPLPSTEALSQLSRQVETISSELRKIEHMFEHAMARQDRDGRSIWPWRRR